MEFFANKLGPLRDLTEDEARRIIARRDAKEAAEREEIAKARVVAEAKARESFERIQQAKQQQAAQPVAPTPAPSASEPKKKKGWF